MSVKNINTRHKQTIFPESDGYIKTSALIDWYTKCQPVGSGPTGIMRMLCAAIEEIADMRGIELPPASGVK